MLELEMTVKDGITEVHICPYHWRYMKCYNGHRWSYGDPKLLKLMLNIGRDEENGRIFLARCCDICEYDKIMRSG